MPWNDVAAWVAIAASVGLGGWGLRQSSRANAHSAQALALARGAEERAERTESLQREKRDVRWEHGWDYDKKSYWAENVGTDTAWNPVLFIDPLGDERRSIDVPPTVDPRGAIHLSLIELVETYVRRASTRREEEDDSVVLQMRAGVTWESESGVQDSASWHDTIVLYDPDQSVY